MPLVLINLNYRACYPLQVFTDLNAADAAARETGALVAAVPVLPDGSPNLAHLDQLRRRAAFFEEVGKL